MTPQAAVKHSPAPQTPPLPHGRPEALGLSSVRLQRMSDAFKREIDKGTLPGATVMVARRGQIGWFDALGRQNPAASAPMAQNTGIEQGVWHKAPGAWRGILHPKSIESGFVI